AGDRQCKSPDRCRRTPDRKKTVAGDSGRRRHDWENLQRQETVAGRSIQWESCDSRRTSVFCVFPMSEESSSTRKPSREMFVLEWNELKAASAAWFGRRQRQYKS